MAQGGSAMLVSENKAVRRPANLNPDHIDLASLNDKGTWSAELTDSLVSLMRPGRKRVLTVARDDVARHIRFNRDLRFRRIVSFAVMDGMKPYSFHIDEHNLLKLLEWLPRKAPQEVRKEVRLHAIVMFLFGIFFLVNHQQLGLEWAAALMGLGVAGLIWAERNVYFFNGLLMFLFGMAQVVPISLAPAGATAVGGEYLPAITATVFLCWGVQQFSMLGLNAQVRLARTAAGKIRMRGTSPLVRRIGRCALIASGFLWAYAVGLIVIRWSELIPAGGATLLEMVGRYPDIAVFLGMALFALSGGCVLTCRRKLMYPDAKVVAQVLIVGFVFVIWGLLATFNPADPLSLFNPMLASGGMVIVKPYVWLSLLPAVMAFNRWYGKALDRELEDQLQ